MSMRTVRQNVDLTSVYGVLDLNLPSLHLSNPSSWLDRSDHHFHRWRTPRRDPPEDYRSRFIVTFTNQKNTQNKKQNLTLERQNGSDRILRTRLRRKSGVDGLIDPDVHVRWCRPTFTTKNKNDFVDSTISTRKNNQLYRNPGPRDREDLKWRYELKILYDNDPSVQTINHSSNQRLFSDLNVSMSLECNQKYRQTETIVIPIFIKTKQPKKKKEKNSVSEQDNDPDLPSPH